MFHFEVYVGIKQLDIIKSGLNKDALVIEHVVFSRNVSAVFDTVGVQIGFILM
jgi:hypothetical protein